MTADNNKPYTAASRTKQKKPNAKEEACQAQHIDHLVQMCIAGLSNTSSPFFVRQAAIRNVGQAYFQGNGILSASLGMP
ncbi:MAG: hypothetical protein K0U74_07735 [Alphaproteobacteria bacterium]|nr:hypothetical protein [Alphaproteobacteria bacterium]